MKLNTRNKVHHTVGNCTGYRFRAWKRRGMNHWRSWEQWQDALRQRLETVFRRHLENGGEIVEVYFHGDHHWNTSRNCFKSPWKQSEAYIAEHVANRVLGFGWKVRLA